MARNKSAEKRNRQNEVLRERNRAYRSRMRSNIKKLRTLVETGDTAAAQAALPSTLGLIERTAQKGVIHRNTAARYKSRLAKLVKNPKA
jgi:small subunit ribosomal protein S20